MSPPWILPSRLFRLCEASVVTARDAVATEADPTMSPNKRNKAQARNGILSRYLKFFFFAKTFHGKVSPFQKPFLNTFLGEGA
jgi:hypothetical protein